MLCISQVYNYLFSTHLSVSISGDCPLELISEVCEDDLCLLEACPAFPNAECIIDDCRVCTARWFDNGKELTEEQCSKFIKI